MASRYISEDVKRQLYIESMGRCMNPSCQKELIFKNGNIIEMAHIIPHCETADNSFQNLVLLCPSCHTNFDKNHAFTAEEVLSWKETRKQEIEELFRKKYATFEELKKKIVPLLTENQTLYKSYYLNDNKFLWDKFEGKILINNRKIKELLSSNMDLFQRNPEPSYSNLACIQTFIAHIDEFEATRIEAEKSREILFPPEINSMFGIAPVQDSILPSTESLECLIKKLKKQGKYETIALGIEHPYIQMNDGEQSVQFFLDDTPRIRQLYYDYGCLRGAKVRLQSLNFALKYIRSRNIRFSFLNDSNLREITIYNKKIVFVYEYCLSKIDLMHLAPAENSVIVNLHNWNGRSCISSEAYILAKQMNVQLLTMDDFYGYVNKIRRLRQ
ncbi:HNH endonuclease [Erysipelotrichaceae bacterium RD49]|nr:HNH endonuclease [Erysipelotrichaceae bacterium RD49]